MLPLWTLVTPEKGLYLHTRVAIVSPLRRPRVGCEGSAVKQQEGGMSGISSGMPTFILTPMRARYFVLCLLLNTVYI
jgi:hypothetical protein